MNHIELENLENQDLVDLLVTLETMDKECEQIEENLHEKDELL